MTKSERAVELLLKDTFATVTSGPGLPPYMKIVFRDLNAAQKAHNMLIEAGFEMNAKEIVAQP